VTSVWSTRPVPNSRRSCGLKLRTRCFESADRLMKRRLMVAVRPRTDRWVLLSPVNRWIPSILRFSQSHILPETLVRWHRAGFLCYWRWSRAYREGRGPRSTKNGSLRVIDPADEPRNPLWGAPRIPRTGFKHRLRSRIERRQVTWSSSGFPSVSHTRSRPCISLLMSNRMAARSRSGPQKKKKNRRAKGRACESQTFAVRPRRADYTNKRPALHGKCLRPSWVVAVRKV